MRSIGLDVHRDFCEVAIAESGRIVSAGRVLTTPEQLELFAGSLAPDDRVALEVTGCAWEIARILRRHVARVIVVSPNDTTISQARAKTDRLDARTLARLLAAGSLDAVWVPDERTSVMRRRLSRREQLVRERTRTKNEVHGVLVRRLVGRPPASDLFGKKGRRWLAGLEGLPVEERETLDSCLRQMAFLQGEIDAVDALIAREALDWPEIRRLMTVPGVNVIAAATFLAAIGDIGRFASPRKLVGYLGLDPKVKQSGTAPAMLGHISKQGSRPARHALVEASWSVVRQPGPLRAFYQRVRARRGHQIAVVAAARKLARLFWCLLTRGEDYAFAQPSLTRRKLRLLELAAGAEHATKPTGVFSDNNKMRDAERALARQAEHAYARTVRDWQATNKGASATPGRASSGSSREQVARQT
jgi:transposase